MTIDHAHPGEALLLTDAEGRFCVATVPADEKCVAHFSWPGTPLIDATQTDAIADLSRRQVELVLHAEPSANLAADSLALGVTARVVGDGPDAPASGLPLTLTNEAGTQLGRATTDPNGDASFHVTPARLLGAPGRGELRVDFGGDPATAAVRRVFAIERRVEVLLTTAPGPSRTLSAGDSEDGIEIAVLATTATGALATAGVVEVSVDGRAAGAAAVENGRARVIATFPGSEALEATLEVRYASEAPWYTPGPDLVLRFPVAPDGTWHRGPLLAASLLVVLWLAVGRTHRLAPAAARDGALPGAPPREARVQVLRPRQDPRGGWTGRVIDAHDGAPVGDVEIRIERPAFGGLEVLAAATSNEAGRFELRCEGARKGDQLVVSAASHATLRQALPGLGDVEIAIVQRRRALVDRLVAWARRRGAPFDGPADPTPGQVARASSLDAKTEAWATAVEQAGFGPAPIDTAAEEEVNQLAPKTARGP